MRAVIVDEPQGDRGTLRVGEIDLTPEPGELVRRVGACGICGTDLHALDHPQVFGTGPGVVMGHEFSGEVVEVTAGVEGWRVGERVAVLPTMACGDCEECRDGYDWRCTRGRGIGLGHQAVSGGYAEFVRVHPNTCFRLPAGLSLRDAALTEPLAVGLHSVRRGRVAAGEPLLIMGAGPVGLFTLVWARLAEASPIVVSDPAPGRRAQALALGADAAVDPGEESPSHRLRDLAGGRWPSVVFDCVGTPPTLEEACRLAGRNGRVAVVGVCLQPYTLQPMTAHGKELDLHYVFGYRRSEYAEALDALAEGAIDPAALISDVIGLDAVPAAFARLRQPGPEIKVLVDPSL